MEPSRSTGTLRCGLLLALVLITTTGFAQNVLRGTVTDGNTGETLIGATVLIEGTTTGDVTDIDGNFEITPDGAPPYSLVISYLGYVSRTIEVSDPRERIRVKLQPDQVMLQEAEVIGSRISDKQKQAPLTVESMDIRAIREAPSGDFYESLGALKGVDLVTASFGFKVINTRGFNSTSPVRSLQLIDGVDNQSPGLNFSLGNFLGASDLDLLRVEVIAGASTAYYGPGAFNGVVNMTTKDPWRFPGLSVSVKGGERNMLEGAVRWAQKFQDKNGKDKWAYKLNVYALTAEDWYAENYAPTINSPTTIDNPGRYDAINVYGDEFTTVNNDFTQRLSDRRDYPGLGLFLRPGYREIDLVDYGTENIKLGGSVHYMIDDSLEAIVASNYSRGSTVYQGENRYRLKDIQFNQQRLEIRKPGTWFVRGYFTGEDAGDTYDVFTTAIRMQEASGSTQRWNIEYFNLWRSVIGNWQNPRLIDSIPGFLTIAEAGQQGINTQVLYDQYLTNWIAENQEVFTQFHQLIADSVNTMNTAFLDPAYIPGTARFDQKLEEIKSKKFTDGGSLFFDRSQLVHGMGEYRFKPEFAQIVVGASIRQYLPNSQGTIFRDTGDVVIRNREFGIYTGLEKPFMENKLRGTVTVRMDKNENFQALFSPAASIVYVPRTDRVFRVSFSSAIRNPTLADQYLYYNVGRALLLGNVDGQFEEGGDSLFTIESFDAYRRTSGSNLLSGLAKLDWFHVERLRPEQVKTVEVGYRGTHWEKFYFDAGAYHSWYNDFIGYILGIDAEFDPTTGFPIGGIQVYRLSANATEEVRTQGASFGVNYYRKHATYGFNYSYNELRTGSDDPIIPAFNTPQNKFNISITGHELRIPYTTRQHLGFGINYRYVESFMFEGSPQFSGQIPSYDMVDVQINVKFPKANLIAKIGASNLFGIIPLFDRKVPDEQRLERVWDNRVLMVFGGPYIGRLAYAQLVYEFDTR